MVMALRLAVLFYRSHTDVALPAAEAHCDGSRFTLGLEASWLAVNPLTAAALKEEVREWRKLGVSLEVAALDEVESDIELSAVD